MAGRWKPERMSILILLQILGLTSAMPSSSVIPYKSLSTPSYHAQIAAHVRPEVDENSAPSECYLIQARFVSHPARKLINGPELVCFKIH